MRLVNADDIVFFGHKDSDLITFKSNIDSLPTVEAIPIEKVARIINDMVADDTPCNYRWLNDKGAGHCEFCDETCKSFEGFRGDGEHWMCWEHAIREGWFDE